jgi:hypothetical protein
MTENDEKPTRREFVVGGVGSLCALSALPALAHGSVDAHTKGGAVKCLNYGRSFLRGTKAFNNVRFWIESRTTIINEATETVQTFYQCASCKSENTFGEKDLFYADNYDFLPIFGGHRAENLLIFRRHARLNADYRSQVKSEDVWGKPNLQLREAKKATPLDTWEKIRDTTAAGTPIVSRTTIRNAKTKLRATIECPVKTMNISLDKKMYQVDTGPIAFPDLAKPAQPLIGCLSLAFVVFNAPHFADFVIEQPTPVIEKEKELCKIYHYSNPISLPAENQLFALD